METIAAVSGNDGTSCVRKSVVWPRLMLERVCISCSINEVIFNTIPNINTIPLSIHKQQQYTHARTHARINFRWLALLPVPVLISLRSFSRYNLMRLSWWMQSSMNTIRHVAYVLISPIRSRPQQYAIERTSQRTKWYRLDCCMVGLYDFVAFKRFKHKHTHNEWMNERTYERIKERTTLLSHKTKQFRVSKHFRAHTQSVCSVCMWCIVVGCLLDWDLVFSCARALLYA